MSKKIFYICSWGGTGSTMLSKVLKKYGETKHIHSRCPPDKLEYIGAEKGGRPGNPEWFNGIAIPEEELNNYYVIFLYRSPGYSIVSRFSNSAHLEHVQLDRSIKEKDVIDSKKDLYKLREFYYNYTRPNKKRNYKIYCVKYEDMFYGIDERIRSNQLKLCKLLGIEKIDFPYKKSITKSKKELDNIYSDLIDEMNKNEAIIIR